MTESKLKRYANDQIKQLTDTLDQNEIQDSITRNLKPQSDKQYKVIKESNESNKCRFSEMSIH